MLTIAANAFAACGGVAFTDDDGGSSGSSGQAGSTNSGGAAGGSGAGGAPDAGSGGNGGVSGRGGASGSGGLAGTGGVGGAAGGGGAGGVRDAGKDAAGGGDGGRGTCADGSVTFQIIGRAPPGYCVGTGCNTSWVSVKTADGQPLGAFFQGCVTTCDVCSPIVCPLACIAPHTLDPNGETQTWNGTYYKQGTCGAGLSCVSPQCILPGTHLVATMCASPRINPDSGLFCQGSDTPRCVDVPFVFPTIQIVTGNVDPVL